MSAADDLDAGCRRVETPCGEGTVAWRVWGTGPALLLGHGAQGAWSHWVRNIPVLARSRTVIAVDLPGQGDSAEPPERTHRAIADVLAAGLRAIVGAEPVDIAAFSMSGTLLAWMAVHHPALVRRIVLIGCGGLDTPHGHIDVASVRGLAGEAREARLRANLLGLMLHDAAAVDGLALELLVANARKARWVDPAMVVPDRLKRALPHIACPVDAIWGEHDRPHPDPQAQAAVIRAVQPDCDFRVIAGAGHWVMYERPDAFDAALRDLLATPLRAVREPESLP
ncbi:MAG: alpha/beta fold hydrolase [Sphingomonadales bacterium]|nr:alpha/beta fold hydrolase [Sphingomonadales bacterium]